MSPDSLSLRGTWFSLRLFCLLLSAAAFTLCSPLYAQDNEYPPGSWHYKSVSCVDTTVLRVEPRLVTYGQKTFTARDFEQSGVDVEFSTYLGSDPVNHMHAAITHYQNTAGNDIMMSERAGDPVQVCFLSRPAPSASCDPDKDPRGRLFRVYDYRQHAQYAGINSEHFCGGA
jgi:hypothetical protein